MKSTGSRVAIITRTKDRPNFLRRALRSVEAQTFKDYTHVIVNDGGDRGILNSIIDEISDDQRSRTVVFHRSESSNAPDTIFNESIDRVSSELFTIHDDDDTWHMEFLERTVDHMDKRPDLGAVVVRTDRVDEILGDKGFKVKKTTQWMPDIRVVSLYRQCIDNQFTPISTLFRRSAYEGVGKFDATLPVVGDWEFGVRLLMKYEADFIDPGFALANYHHRAKTGSSEDQVSSDNKHRYYTNLVMNRYLRDEVTSGKFGVGYIMSSNRHSQAYIGRLIKRILPRSIFNRVKKRVQY